MYFNDYNQSGFQGIQLLNQIEHNKYSVNGSLALLYRMAFRIDIYFVNKEMILEI